MTRHKTDMKQELEERLRFEKLLTDISARFINLPAKQIDGAIEDAQRSICECLGVDLSSLWQWTDENPRTLTLTHLYSPPPPIGPVRPDGIDAQEALPWICSKVLNGETLVISTEKLPPEAKQDQITRRGFNVKSSVVIPLSAGGGPVIGVLSFDDLKVDRVWPAETVDRLVLITQVFSNALERRRFEQDLIESKARLDLAADSAESGIWEMDCRTGTFWATRRARAIFGYDPEEPVTMERFEASIIPEDLDLVREAITRSLIEGEPVNIEYRILAAEGSFKWILSQGRPHFNPSGEPERLMGVSIDISEKKQIESQLQRRLAEIENLRHQLEKENIYLRKKIELQNMHGEIVGQSQVMKQILAQVEQVARTDTTVLIEGETGTGKELFARAVHRLSANKDRPLVTVNCASLPPTLIESELFGREKGAYTGAMTRMTGRFEMADGATLFLDEIGELPLDVQAKLLRVLEHGRFERLGSTKTLQVNVRIIAASNRDLARDVDEGKFRKDLYYRLNVFPIVVPPLHERTEDIPLLVWSFVRQYEKKMGKRIERIPRKSMETLQCYPWPGNVRELRNMVEHAMIVSSGKTLDIHNPQRKISEIPENLRLLDVERRHILIVLQKSDWRLSGRGGAAEILGLKRTTLQSKIKKLGIKRPTK